MYTMIRLNEINRRNYQPGAVSKCGARLETLLWGPLSGV